MAPPLNPDPDTARRLLDTELRTGGYHLSESWLSRLMRWLNDLADRIAEGVNRPWQSTAVWAVVIAVALVVIAILVRRAYRRIPPKARAEQPETSEPVRLASADELREQAARARAEGDFDTAVINSVRAIMRASDDAGLLRLRDGLTVTEASMTLAAELPEAASDLTRMANLFALARYGHRVGAASCTEQDADFVTAVDAEPFGSPRAGGAGQVAVQRTVR